MAVNQYKYISLSTDPPGFRLVKLLRGDTIKVECEIFSDVLSDSGTHAYEALSYTWGNTELAASIDVDGQELWITENLYSALLCLRSRDQDRVMWIDAICINQSDQEERSQQVSQIGKIFSFATRVVFWLGRPTVEVTLLMSSLIELQQTITFSSQGTVEADIATWKQRLLVAHDAQESHGVNRTTQQQKGLETLLRRPWFERVWILQEVLNAQSAIVVSGTFSVSIEIFALSTSFFNHNPSFHVQSVLDIMPKSNQIGKQLDCKDSRARDRLINLLVKFRACKATDQRDMIFALLNMSVEPLDHQLLRPDYTKSLSQVIHNAVRYWLEATDVTISQVLYVLTGFETIRATYLIPVYRTTTASEALDVSSEIGENSTNVRAVLTMLKGEVRCVRDASLFLLEEYSKDDTKAQNILHNELDQLGSMRDVDGFTYHAESQPFLVTSWPNSPQSVKLLIVWNVVEALLLISRLRYTHIFDFIVDRGTEDKQKLINDALCRAVDRRETLDVVQLLLDKGADVNAQGETGENVLQVALASNRTEIARLLVVKGANVNGPGEPYGSALQAACLGFASALRSSEGQQLELVQLLLERGADVNAQGGEYGNALQAVSSKGLPWRVSEQQLSSVRLLLERGANVNAQGGVYGNALQAASANGLREIVELLLREGADVNARGGAYGSALQAALSEDRKQIVQILQDWVVHHAHEKVDAQH